MKNEDIRQLALSLATVETEDGVVRLLKEVGLWDDDYAWRELDESSGNWSTIGNQQSSADTALVEKVINSVDAVLMRECLDRGILPTGDEAPQSIAAAQKIFFGICNGKLSSIDASIRSKIAENIYLVASGPKGPGVNPSYSIIDLGEGQKPDSFHKTFLSLNKGNKSRVQFVQGKFGMGGTGVFRFGSPIHNLQLIISKRDPNIKEEDKSEQWGVTIIRRILPSGQMRSSIFTYLAPNGKILSFNSNSLPLLPGNASAAPARPLSHGTFIKIYEYHIGAGRLKSDATRHLHNRLSLLMPDIALPIKVVDERYEKSPVKILSGLSVRLDEDKRDNLEEDFPGSGEIVVSGQKMDYSIYAFKIGKRETYAGNEGIIFTVNGQVHGFLPKSFFSRKLVGMSYLSDSILMIVDCSRIDRATQEKLFMNSRDRLAGGPLQAEIEQKIEDIIKNHQGLRDLREKRKRELIENKLQDSRPLTEVLENIIKKSPSLLSLFAGGVRIKNPFRLEGVAKKEDFRGVKFPTHFKLAKEYPKDRPKSCPINVTRSRVQFETDTENDYFKRDKEPGELVLRINGNSIEDYSCNLWNGLATVNIGIPDNVTVGDTLQVQTEVNDITRPDPFSSEFYIKIDQAQENNGNNHHGKRKQPPSDKLGQDRQKPVYLDIPNTIEVRSSDWGKHGFSEKSALKVMDGGDDTGYDFYINMDNIYLQMEIKEDEKTDPKLLEARFKYGMVLLGISLLDFEEKGKKDGINPDSDDASIYERISLFTSAISPTLLPMIVSLGDLEVE
jgi:hypothetical protein